MAQSGEEVCRNGEGAVGEEDGVLWIGRGCGVAPDVRESVVGRGHVGVKLVGCYGAVDRVRRGAGGEREEADFATWRAEWGVVKAW